MDGEIILNVKCIIHTTQNGYYMDGEIIFHVKYIMYPYYPNGYYMDGEIIFHVNVSCSSLGKNRRVQ